MDNQNMVYMAYDGDNAGRLCGRAILADNPDALHEVSARISLGHEVVKKWVESHGGQFISGGGDEGVFSIPAEAINSIEELRADYEFATNLTATVGIGSSLSEAGKAMLVGKFRGKNQVVQYNAGIENEISQAQEHMQNGTASAEEKKIGEAYLQPQPEGTISTMNNSEAEHTDCQYCQAMETEQVDDASHCRYCHDAEQAEPCPYCVESDAVAADAAHDCPYCQNPQAGDDCPYCQDGAHDPSIEGHPDDCPYCAESASAAPAAGDDQTVNPTAGPTVKNPTTTDSQDYAGQDFNEPDLPKPDAIQSHPDGLGVTVDSPTNENIKLDVEGQGDHDETNSQAGQSIDPQSEETLQEIAQEIDSLPNYESRQETVAQIDTADMAVGTATEGNISRPEDYAKENNPTDMGLGEEEQGDESAPDVTSLMQEGLDSHADNIQREKIVNLVSEALVGFKSCKGILEKAREQAPQLYESSIAMLKAMIEMCKMLGLDQEAQAGDSADPLGDSQGGSSNPSNGALPAGGAVSGAGAGEPADGLPAYEQREGGNPEKKSEGAVGQSVGKLPTSATTHHVARTPQLPNATNAKGQKKVVDPVNGRIRWIDMKEGKVKSPTGVPVKPDSKEEETGQDPNGH